MSDNEVNNYKQMKFFIMKFFLDLVTFTEDIVNGKLYFLCSENVKMCGK